MEQKTEGEKQVSVSYKPLWKLLIYKGWRKKDLQEAVKISPFIIAKLGRNEDVTTAVLTRVCEALGCQIEDICEVENQEVQNVSQ